MMVLCKDRDVLAIEPAIVDEAAQAAQRLLLATGTVNGTALTISGGSFLASAAQPGMLIRLTGDGLTEPSVVCELASVSSATAAVVSVLREGETATPIPITQASVSNVRVEVLTFHAQRRIASRTILADVGIDPDDPTNTQVIVNPTVLRDLCALMTLRLIYSSVSSASPAQSPLSRREASIGGLIASMRRATLVQVDTNGDGAGDVVRVLGTSKGVRLERGG